MHRLRGNKCKNFERCVAEQLKKIFFSGRGCHRRTQRERPAQIHVRASVLPLLHPDAGCGHHPAEGPVVQRLAQGLPGDVAVVQGHGEASLVLSGEEHTHGKATPAMGSTRHVPAEYVRT